MSAETPGAAPTEIRGPVVLPARREDVELRTADGLVLVGELATPIDGAPVATLVTLHPLPTAGGFMDSHILRKAAARLPALAGIAVLRFNFRGVASPRGTSDGAFGDGVDEGMDLAAAVSFVRSRGLPAPWLLGWSFGTEVVLKHGLDLPTADAAGGAPGTAIAGAILLSPPLRRTTQQELARWAGSDVPIVAIIPELDDFLRPPEARERFAVAPNVELVEVAGGKHLWVGEEQTYRVLTEIVARLNPAALPLPTVWTGPIGRDPA